MIVDIEKIAEDDDLVCYRGLPRNGQASVFILKKSNMSVTAVVCGDADSCAGAIAKVRRTASPGNFSNSLSWRLARKKSMCLPR